MEFIDVIPAQQRYGEFWYRGTADAIFQNIYTLERENSEHVLILAGDHIYRMDYLRMLEFHIEREADLTIAAVEAPACESEHLGVLEVDEGRNVRDFKEKPQQTPSLPGKPGRIYASMGIYIFKKDVLLEELLKEGGDDRYDFGKHILPELVGKRRLLAYPFVDRNRTEGSYWRDIGTLDAFYETNMDLVSVEPQFNLYDRDWPIRTHQIQSPPAKTVFAGIDDRDRISEVLDSLICSGCIISGGRVERSILSPMVRIHSFASVEESILMSGVDVARHARIRRAIVDKYVQILPGTKIGYELENDRRRFTVTDSGVVVIPRGRIIGPDSDSPRWNDPARGN
jgi:glucose-1-phosphate adenylyltransferase